MNDIDKAIETDIDAAIEDKHSKPQHTPTPWTTENLNPFILGPDENAVCQMTWGKRPMAEEKANAALIVRAVNAHDQMLEALKIALFHFQGESKAGRYVDVPGGFDHDISMEGLIGNAIARAEGK